MATFIPDSALADSTMLAPKRNVTNGRYARLIVVHTMEAPETYLTARNVAAYFARGEVNASAHYNLDAGTIVQGVPEKDVAWAAPGANHDGIQLEHAGYAGQNAAGWNDAYSQAMLDRSARLVADICYRNGIPPKVLTLSELIAGEAGICSHHQVSVAYKQSDHWDPGYSFPWAQYQDLITRYYALITAGDRVSAVVQEIINNHPEEDIFMAITAEELGTVLYEKVTKPILDELTPGKEGVKHAGTTFMQLARIQDRLQGIEDALTPGKEGVKHAGAMYGQADEIRKALKNAAEKPVE